MGMLPKSLSHVGEWAIDIWKRKNTAILTGVGVTGMFSAAVWAVAETPKAMRSMEEMKEDLHKEKLSPWEAVKATWRIYILPGSVELLSAGCIIAAFVKNERKSAAMAAACTLAENTYEEYRKQVKETIGERKERAIQDNVDAVKTNGLDPEKAVPPVVENVGNVLIFEALTNHLYYGTMESVRAAENEMNRLKILNDGMLNVNDYLGALKLDDIPIGNDVGWSFDPTSGNESEQFRIRFSAQLIGESKTPCMVIRPERLPTYDFS